MSKLLSEKELEGRMDCFGEFECTDEICLSHCGVNIACAASSNREEQEDWAEEDGMDGLPSMGLD